MLHPKSRVMAPSLRKEEKECQGVFSLGQCLFSHMSFTYLDLCRLRNHYNLYTSCKMSHLKKIKELMQLDSKLIQKKVVVSVWL